MQKMMAKQSALIVAMTLVLTACGGGDSSSNSTTPTSTTPKPTTQTQPTTAPITTAPAQNTGATTTVVNNTNNTNTTSQTTNETPMAVLNNQRTTCGFSALTNHNELAKASKNHNHYMGYISETNAKLEIFASHDEKAETGWKNSGIANPYFSGQKLAERVKTGNNKGKDAVTVNYPFATSYGFQENGVSYTMSGSFITENIATFSHNASGTQLLRNLLASPYHLKSLVSQYYNDVGVHFHTSNEWKVKGYSPIKANYLTVVLGLQQGQTPKITNKTLSYPCNNISGVEHTLTHEYPDPFTGHSRGNISETNPIGQPVYIVSAQAKNISNIKNISFKPINGVVAPKVWVMFKNANPSTNLQHMKDAHGRLQANEAFLIPDTKLQPATTYEVSYTLVYQDNSTENAKFRFTTKTTA